MFDGSVGAAWRGGDTLGEGGDSSGGSGEGSGGGEGNGSDSGDSGGGVDSVRGGSPPHSSTRLYSSTGVAEREHVEGEHGLFRDATVAAMTSAKSASGEGHRDDLPPLSAAVVPGGAGGGGGGAVGVQVGMGIPLRGNVGMVGNGNNNSSSSSSSSPGIVRLRSRE